MTLYYADLGDIPPGIQQDEPVLDGELDPLFLGLDLILHDPDGPGLHRPVLGGRVDVEGLLGDRAVHLHGVEGLGGILEARQLGHHVAPLGHDLTGRDGERDVHVGQVPLEEDDVGAAARGDAADVAPHPEPFGGVQGRHLEGGYGVNALVYGVAHHEVHVPLLHKGLGAAIIGDKQDVPRIEAALGVGFYGLRYVVPGGAPPELEIGRAHV